MTPLASPASYRLGHTPGRRPARIERRIRLALGGLALAATAGLLVLFEQVVSASVQQSRQRHEASARHSAATWRCTGMPSLRLRDDCLAELNAPPPQTSLLASP